MNTDTIKDWLARKTELAQKEANNPEEYMAKCEQLAFSTPLALEIARLAVEELEELSKQQRLPIRGRQANGHLIPSYGAQVQRRASELLRKIQTLIES